MKILFTFSIVYTLLLVNTWAQEAKRTYTFSDYDAAKKSATFIKFDMKSSKLGLITSSFDGFAKNFVVQGNLLNKEGSILLENLSISFPVESLDTDNGSRNEKMQETCLGYEKDKPQSPSNTIVVNFSSPISLGEDKTYPATIRIRGKNKTISVRLSTQIKENKVEAKGQVHTKLSSLEVPDPSIAIASVKDDVLISFSIIDQLPAMEN